MAELDPSVLLGSQYYVNTGDSPAQVRDGIAAMARAGLKLVRIFLQWTHVEPRQGHWDWSQYDALFDAAAQEGLGVIVTLTSLHPPGWMNISSGPQDIGPLEDPVFMQRGKEYIRQVVRRYSSHPALHSWILTNEPSIVLPKDEAVLRRYQRFLEQKYGGDIEALNRRSYPQVEAFDQVSLESAGSEFAGYTARLNWSDFQVQRLLEVLTEIKDAIRAAGDSHPVHVNPHNLVGDLYRQGQSIWSEGRLVDFMGCSAHPSWHSTRFLPDRLHQSVAIFADLMRGATRAPGRHFWVTELQGGTNIYSGETYLGPTGEDLRAWIWESIGAGAKAVVFWCFNFRNQGFEAGEWGLVDQQNRPSRRLEQVSQVAGFLQDHRAVFAASRPPRARVALLYSEATWKLGRVEGKGSDPASPRNMLMGADALVGAWSAFADAGVSVDFLDEIDLQNGLAQGYPALVLPGCTALEEASLPALRAYVEGGGTLLADGLCGYKQPDGWLRDAAGNPLNDLFHASVGDIQALPGEQWAAMEGGRHLPLWFLKVVLEPGLEGRTLAWFPEPNPRPALVEGITGRGRTLRLGTIFFQRYFHHPDIEAFATLLAWLNLPAERATLLNPSPYLRLRHLDLTGQNSLYSRGREILVLLNAGAATTARLQIAPGYRLVQLLEAGEQPIDTSTSEVLVPVEEKNSVVLMMVLDE